MVPTEEMRETREEADENQVSNLLNQERNVLILRIQQKPYVRPWPLTTGLGPTVVPHAFSDGHVESGQLTVMRRQLTLHSSDTHITSSRAVLESFPPSEMISQV